MVNIRIEEYSSAVIICLKGEFMFESVLFAEQVWDEQRRTGHSVIAVDCSELDFIDSSAIGILVKFLNQSKNAGIDMVFLDPSDSVMPIFKTARLESFFTFMNRKEFFDQYVQGA